MSKYESNIEYQMMMDQIQKVMPALMGAYPKIAEITKAYYDELVKQGFTESQALHIVTEQGWRARMDTDD